MSLGFYVDSTRCTGCKACAVACKDIKELPVNVALRRVFSFEAGKYPNASSYHYSMGCNHCEMPKCVVSCTTGALTKAGDGTVQIDVELCIGCKACIEACPYEAPQFRSDISIVQKCDACIERRDAGKQPSCVDACPMRALKFGENEEFALEYGSGLVKDLPFLPSSGTTNSNTMIKAKPVALSEDFRRVVL